MNRVTLRRTRNSGETAYSVFLDGRMIGSVGPLGKGWGYTSDFYSGAIISGVVYADRAAAVADLVKEVSQDDSFTELANNIRR